MKGNHSFVGARNDVPCILRKSDIILSTSDHEGLPNVILEAMAAGKPVIATNVGGNKEAVCPEETGFLLAPGDVNGFVEKMSQLITNSTLRAHYGQKGKELVDGRS